MTTTKMIYLATAILPFGFVVLAAALLARALIARYKARTPAHVPSSMLAGAQSAK